MKSHKHINNHVNPLSFGVLGTPCFHIFPMGQEFAHYTTYPMALSPHFGRVLCRLVGGAQTRQTTIWKLVDFMVV